MNLLVWIATGTVLGSIAGIVAARGRPEYLLNIVAGIAGALLGGWLLAPMFGSTANSISHFSKENWMTTIGSTLALLAIVNLLRDENSTDHSD